mmetsp:Transcript_27833/g.68755  ORF Transcript_27833/g.68755 Transcript_27833/m.68755 type:complete len:269 (+) Transcript_27833:1371-2177(+)
MSSGKATNRRACSGINNRSLGDGTVVEMEWRKPCVLDLFNGSPISQNLESVVEGRRKAWGHQVGRPARVELLNRRPCQLHRARARLRCRQVALPERIALKALLRHGDAIANASVDQVEHVVHRATRHVRTGLDDVCEQPVRLLVVLCRVPLQERLLRTLDAHDVAASDELPHRIDVALELARSHESRCEVGGVPGYEGQHHEPPAAQHPLADGASGGVAADRDEEHERLQERVQEAVQEAAPFVFRRVRLEDVQDDRVEDEASDDRHP